MKSTLKSFRRHFYPLLSTLLLFLLFLHRMVFTNLILARGDIFLYFYPYWQKAAEALRAGQVPLWNPQLFMGAPFVANSQVGFFYPLNWLLWLALSPPPAVKATILLHLALAAAGTYVLARLRLRLSPWASALAAVLFALGGYLTAQVEHVNQLQGLTWLPWLLVAVESGAELPLPQRVLLRGLALSLLLAFQLTAGHMQSVFISGMALLLWGAATMAMRFRGRDRDHRESRASGLKREAAAIIVPLFVASLFALLLAGVQIVPTLELTALSSRQAGLSVQEATSFSLHPLLIAPSILPTYGRTIFSEYVAFLPVTALLMALVGAWRWRKEPLLARPLVLAGAGLFLALGRFNPLYLLLARVPGFNLFRAPARWLVLYAFGMSLLAGAGWDLIRSQRPQSNTGARKHSWRPRVLHAGVVICLMLVVWYFLAVPLARYVPLGAETEVMRPSLLMVLGWLAELLVAYLLIAGRAMRLRRCQWLRPAALLAVSVLVLFLSSRSQSYHRNLTTPVAYRGLRPTISRLRAMQRCDLLPEQCTTPPGRVLSLSDTLFDPGDLAEINGIYGNQLSDEALLDYVVAVKQKAIVAPNLPMAYGLSSVDGFDGGILPLRDYTSLVQLFLPPGVSTTDGRLREHLDGIPDARWLDLFNARFLITDKVGDVWRQGVFFDMQHPVTLAPGQTVSIGAVPAYEATEIWMIGAGEPGRVLVGVGKDRWQIEPQSMVDDLWRVRFPQPVRLESIALAAGSERWRVRGLALVDERDDTFRSMVPGLYRQILSGDVKIYENLDVLSRAVLLQRWRWQPSVSSALSAMSGGAFNPRREVLIVGEGAPNDFVEESQSEVKVSYYSAEEVVVKTASKADGVLMLTDAYYPGWRATLDGREVPVYRADAFFRGVFVPAGDHEVRFEYRPRSFTIGRGITLGALLLWAVLAFGGLATFRERAKIDSRET